jgi:hypothetical protein
MLKFGLGLASLLLLGACAGNSLPEGPYCTLLGCEAGLNITLPAEVSQAYQLKLTATGKDEMMATCPAEGSSTLRCWPAEPGQAASVFVPQYTPEEVTIEITTDDQVLTQTVKPSYKDLKPNGPDCSPTCTQATIELKASDFKPKAP